ncbi:MAG: hypothetical protein ABW007_06315 [Chitinophagaceae bacterium]
MGRRVIWSSDLPETGGKLVEVADPDELQKVFIGVGGDVFQVDLTEGQAQTFKKSLAKYIAAAESNHDEHEDPKHWGGAYDTKVGYRKGFGGSVRPGASALAAKPGMSGPELAAKVDGLFWIKSNKFGTRIGDPVAETSKGMKPFVEAMGQDAGTSRIPNDSYWAAIEKAMADGLVGKKDQLPKGDDTED